jgi:hypothetical protein
VKFTGCTSSLGECKSGAVAGEIETKQEIRTRRASQPSGEVLFLVLVLNNKGESATSLATAFKFKCGSFEVEVWGSFLVKGGGNGKLKTKYTFKGEGVENAKKEFENTPSEYENSEGKKVKEKLESCIVALFPTPVTSAEEATQTSTFEEEAQFE